MRIGPKIKNRFKLLMFRQLKRKKLIESLLESDLPKNKLFVFFTMDLEYHPEKFKKYCYEGFSNYFDIIKKNKIKSTFFVQGEFAEDHRKELTDLLENGHEIGSHGYGHINLGPDIWWGKDQIRSNNFFSRKSSIIKNHNILTKILKKPPVSFRAPFLSIDNLTIKIIKSFGYKIDSSLNNAFYGLPSVPYYPGNDMLEIGNNNIIEFCISTSLSKNLIPKITDLSTLDFQRITFLKESDFSKNISIIEECKNISPYIVILTHPIDFSETLNSNFDERIKVLSKFISSLMNDFNVKFSKISEIIS